MRELFYKIKQLGKCRPVDLHRNMLSVKYDAVLIIIYIRRILESPFSSVDGDGDDPVVLSGRMIQTSGIAFILHTELTLGIAVVLRIFGQGQPRYRRNSGSTMDILRRRRQHIIINSAGTVTTSAATG